MTSPMVIRITIEALVYQLLFKKVKGKGNLFCMSDKERERERGGVEKVKKTRMTSNGESPYDIKIERSFSNYYTKI